MMKIKQFVPVIFITAALFGCSNNIDSGTAGVTNGNVWKDSSGSSIQAHDNIIKYGSKYYWYGMDYSNNLLTGDNKGFKAIKCYESTDLVNWTFKNNVLTSTSSDLLYYCDINAPAVVYNPNTGKFVMWMGYNTSSTEKTMYTSSYEETTDSTKIAHIVQSHLNYTLVATCDTPYGNFEVENSTFKINDGAVVTTLYKDADNTGYALSYCIDSSDDIYKLFIYELNSDYLSINTTTDSGVIAKLYPTVEVGRTNIVRYGDYYYLFAATFYGDLTNGSTNYNSSKYKMYGYSSFVYYNFYNTNVYLTLKPYTGVRYAYAKSLAGPWSGLQTLGPDSYTSQEFGSVITVLGTDKTSYLLAFNKWSSSDLSASGYVWQPLTFDDTAAVPVPSFTNNAAVTIDASAGTVTGE
jgi:hypothetical protein